ncbi:MAG: zinc-ribbon domain-containing protein [Defluviitaleaceae bacterium]|nr:zinc-ribbon domain-containing protein [Defluviitaleaceae bacterium]
MYCKKCGNQLSATAVFCDSCRGYGDTVAEKQQNKTKQAD